MPVSGGREHHAPGTIGASGDIERPAIGCINPKQKSSFSRAGTFATCENQVGCDMKSNEFKGELSGITCYFVGNAHDFSEPAIELATISFKSVRFERLETIEDLLSLDVDRVDRVRSIILNQSMGITLFFNGTALYPKLKKN